LTRLLPTLVLGATLLGAGAAGAIESRLPVERFTVDDGLPENSVRAILQDRQGFLWFGTQAGLARYDGYDMYQPWHTAPDSTSVPRLLVTALHQDGLGQIWIGTMHEGLWRVDPTRESFERVACRIGGEQDGISGFSADQDGNVWIAWERRGLCLHEPAGACSRTLTHDPDRPGTLPTNDINGVFIDSRGTMWVATYRHGLARQPSGRDEFVVHRADPDSERALPHDQVNAVHEDQDGRIWITTYQGLSQWLPRERAFRSYVPDPTESVEHVNYLLGMVDGADAGLWIGSAVGLYHFDTETSEFQLLAHDPENPRSPVKGPVLSVYRDRSGVIWGGSWQAGMNKLDPLAEKFEFDQHDPEDPTTIDDDAVRAVLEDSRGTIWLGTGTDSTGGTIGGLNRRDGRGYARVPIPSAAVRAVLSLAEDTAERIWVGTNAGIWELDRERGTVERAFASPDPGKGIGDASVLDIVNGEDGEVWACVPGLGIYRLDPESGSAVRYAHDPSDSRSISENRVICAFRGANGRLWFGTDTKGLLLYRPETDDFERYMDVDAGLTSIIDVYEDSRDYLWLGTYAGLLRFDPDEGRIVDEFSTRNGLPHDLVSAILEDDQGRLWVSTSRGVARIDVDSRSIRRFDERDGLPSNQQCFGRARGSDGTMYLGGFDGLIRFRPDQIRDRDYLPPVVLTGLLIGDAEQAPSPDGPLSTALPYARNLEFDHTQNDLTISFASLDFTSPRRNRYRYRLVNYDDDWRNARERRSATYTNLHAGDYRFEVMGSNSDGVWNASVASLEFTVHPPWWSSGWAILLYVAASLGLVAFIYHQVVQRERAQAALAVERAEARQLQQLDEFKTRFFANISHEFRTPLTLIQAPLTRLETDPSGGDRVLFGMMARNARRLRELIDQLLDLARLDARRLPLKWKKGDWAEYLRVLVVSFDSLARDHGVKIRQEIPEDAPHLWYDADILEKVVGNLLSNAIRYTPEGGDVSVRVSLRESEEPVPVPLSIGDPDAPSRAALPARWASVEVANTGSYIAPADRARIFDRFQQIGGRSTEGSGVGLSLVKEFVEWMHGSIDVVSSLESGTSFIATLPLFATAPGESVEGDAASTDGSDAVPLELGAAAGEDTGTSPTSVPMDATERALVLVVEDNDDMRLFLRQGLKSRYRVLVAPDGVEGLRIALEEVPDLIISDVIMPRMDGIELSKKLKDDDRTNHIPIILLTARAEGESRKEGLQTGADAYLAKPFDPEELRIRVDNLIEQRQLLAEKYARQISGLSPEAMPVTSADERFLVRARGVVEAHLDDVDLDVTTLCREIGISRAQLHRKLKSLTGQSTSEFVRTHRLQRASELLKGKYGNVTEVAFAVGFQSQSYFARCFRQQYGMSPSEYLHQD
jgi:signal transduction histidine kinase/ligand-binding sensor domain-containing protein/DNA-binding response OmpR family regulator